MKTMKTENGVCVKGNEQGFILTTALWILLVLTLVGITAVMTSNTELQIGANDKFRKIAFYATEGGIATSTKMISQAIDQGGDVNYPNTDVATDGAKIILYGATKADAYPGVGAYTTNRFYNEILGFEKDTVAGTPDMFLAFDDESMEVDIAHVGSKAIAGGGAEFGSGASGAGYGSKTGVKIIYDLTSIGSGPSNARAQIAARYRKVVGAAGGL